MESKVKGDIINYESEVSSEASDFFLIIGVETVGRSLISWKSVYSIMDFC